MVVDVITLRTATSRDIPFLADVIANVQAQTDPSIDVDEYRRAMVESITSYFGQDEPESVLSVIELDGAPVGRLRIVRFDDRIFLGGIQVHPDHQRKGIGTRLITDLIEESRSARKPLELDVEHANVGARRLYERLGLVRQSESEKDIRMAFVPE